MGTNIVRGMLYIICLMRCCHCCFLSVDLSEPFKCDSMLKIHINLQAAALLCAPYPHLQSILNHGPHPPPPASTNLRLISRHRRHCNRMLTPLISPLLRSPITETSHRQSSRSYVACQNPWNPKCPSSNSRAIPNELRWLKPTEI